MPLRALRSHPSPLYRLPGSALVMMSCAVAIALTVGLSSLFAWRDREAILRQAHDMAGNVSLLVAEHAARLVETSDLILKQAAELAGPAEGPVPDGQANWERLMTLARSTPYVVSIWLGDADGKAVLTTRQFPAPNLSAAGRDYFQAQKTGTGGLYLSPLPDSPFGDGPLILLSRPLAAAPGTFRGVAVVAVSPRYISDIYRSIDLDYARAITLRKGDGTVLLRETEGDTPEVPDGPTISVERRVDGSSLIAEVSIPMAAVMAHWHDRLWGYASYGLAALTAIVVIGALAIKRTRREREAEDALQHAYDTLEQRVHSRTAELEQSNSRLEAALTDKEVLLKEVQHRVKNNLQVICSLLRLQAARIDESARRAFDESLRRIQCMSLMQELLYRSDQPARIDFADYLRQLCDGLVRTTNPTGARLTVEADAWVTDVDQATPLALIASELVSNALLHAFPAGHPGTVTVELRPETADTMRLVVRDDGIGLPPGMPTAQRKGAGLGLVLVQSLAQQANAVLRIEHGNGTCFTLSIAPLGARRPKAA